MRRWIVRMALGMTVGVLAGSGPAPGQAPPETLPAPRVLLAPPPAVVLAPGSAHVVYPGFYRTSHYAIWENHGIDRQGRWRPRVAYSPYGSYYLYNGQPFPWSSILQREWMPYIVDSP
jgi:hypothetical protein